MNWQCAQTSYVTYISFININKLNHNRDISLYILDAKLNFLLSLIHLENLVDQIGTDHPFDTITELIEEVLGNDLNF